MSYANGTPFLNLPQTVGTDHRDWFDTNAAFLDFDTKMKTLWDGASSTANILEQLQETVSSLDTDLAALTTIVNGHTTTLQTVNESLVLINSALTSLNTDVRTKFDSAGVADPYDPTYGTYDVDDVVSYNGQRYKCITAVTAAEPFDADKWSAEDVQTVINKINSDLSSIITGINGMLVTSQIPLNCAGNTGAQDYSVNIPVPTNSTLLTIEQSVNTGNAIPHIKQYSVNDGVLTVQYSVYRIVNFAETQNVVTKALFVKTIS